MVKLSDAQIADIEAGAMVPAEERADAE